jgi:hypothetical protein
MSGWPSGLRAVTLALLLVASATLAGVGAAQSATQDSGPEDGPSPADDVYVGEDGDAVLVYSEPANGSSTTYDVDTDSGLAYAVLTDPTAGGEGLQTDLTASATPTQMQADGEMVLQRPPSLTGLALDVSALTNETASRADASLNATLSGVGFARLIESAVTSGDITASASRLRASGQFDADLSAPLAGTSSYEARLTESGEGYTLRIDENRTVGEFGVENWQNRSAARDTIERQQGALARSLGGSASITVETYDFDAAGEAGRSRLDIAYTVTYRNVDAGIESAVRSELAADPEVNRSEADRVASEMTNVTVGELAVRYEADGSAVSGGFDVDVSDYDGLALAYLDVADSLGNTTGAAYTGNVEQARAQVAAQQAVGLEQRVDWSGSLSHPEEGATRLQFSYHERTTNRSAYVDELASRDVPTYNSSLSLSGGVENDTVVLNGSAETSGEGLFDGLASTVGNGSGVDDTTSAFVDAVRRSGPQKAKLQMSTGADGLTLETGAAVAQPGALTDVLATQGLPGFTGAVGRTTDGETRSYVRLNGALPGDASEADVRSLAVVNDSTTVHMPGEWDREFPATDTDRAEEFLGSVPGREGTGSSGVGAVVGLFGLAGTGLLVTRD